MTRTQRLRRALERAATLSDTSDSESYPLDDLIGWSNSVSDPGELVAATEILRVRQGYKLVGYTYSAGADGNGAVWALPDSAPLLEPGVSGIPEPPSGSPPRQQHAIEPMNAIEGDGSPWSYLAASLLHRQFLEWGAKWHGISWGIHEILCRDPWRKPQRTASDLRSGPHTPPDAWNWLEPPPDDWRPLVKLDEDSAVVRFFTFSALGGETITCNEDWYNPPSYRPEISLSTIGKGGGGFIF